jgi:hypothetical protein
MEIVVGSQTFIVDYTVTKGMKSTDPYMVPDDPDELTIHTVSWVYVDKNGNDVEIDITDLYHERMQDGEIEDTVWETHYDKYE